MNRGTILITTGNTLCNNPRVIKEADALAEAGYRVEVHGSWINPISAERDRDLMAARKWTFRPVLDLTKANPSTRLLRTRIRVRSKIGKLLASLLGIENTWQLGYSTAALYAEARRIRADLTIAHSEQTLWVAKKLHQLGLPVGIDMEDWFSEDLPKSVRKARPLNLLRHLEQYLLVHSVHTTSTSQAMTDALVNRYGCPPPVPIYNAFPWSDRETIDGKLLDKRSRSHFSIHWFSQTLGPGRGLELLFEALPLVRSSFELHLRGSLTRTNRRWLEQNFPASSRSRLFTHEHVRNRDLLSRISEHNIGYSGETSECRSRDVTVTNKILHYLLAGLPVVASDTAGHREVQRATPDAVRIFPQCSPSHLAHAIDNWISTPTELSKSREAALMAASQLFSWEQMKSKLLASIANAFNLTHSTLLR